MTNLEGQTFAGYEVLSKLGEGGMGAVYKARQPLLNRLVALKVMSPHLGADPSFVARFVREASAAANLNHPNMVQVYTAGEADGMHFIAMEFVEGESLQKRLHRLGRIEPREAIAIAVYVAQALQYAWNKARLIHRDIKPDNVFLSNSGEVKVGDLGLAKSVGGETTELTQTGTAMGSPHYISPEQATGLKEVDFRTDIYSLGCTLYHMLTGKTPYSGDSSMAVMMKHVNDPPPAIFKTWPACPMPLGMLVGKMLAKDRNARPQSYEQLVEDLMAVHEKIKNMESVRAVAVTPTAAQPKSATPPVQATVAARPSGKPKNLKVIYAAAGAAAVVALAGLLLWSPWKAKEEEGGQRQAAEPVSAAVSPAAPAPSAGEAGKMPALPVETAAPREAAPAAAKLGVLFDGRDTSAWQQRDGGDCQWQVSDGALVAGQGDLDTREKFQDFKLHIEFAVPRDAKQGNSGIYLQGRYEVQILDSFGKSADDGSCGSIFRLKAPTENASKPPDEWQTFDITFHAARFDVAGAKTANARVSIVHNGRLIHDYVEIPKSTGKGEPESAAPGPIRLQSYGSPVRFRNISIKPVDEAAVSPVAESASVQPGAADRTLARSATDTAGFVPLFNGKDLTGWEGRPEFWSVQDGAICGRTTQETPAKQNTFLVCTAGEFSDFELRAQFKLAAGDEKGIVNSGIQYRSRIVDREYFMLSGYQADLGFRGRKNLSGTLWEEGGRSVLADSGQRVVLREGESPTTPQKAVESINSARDVRASYRDDDWNDLVIIASGNRLQHYLNGKLAVEVTDETAAAAKTGTLALQIKAGPPMQVWFRNLLIKKLAPDTASAAPPAALQNAINLLPLIDPQKDAVAGTWTFQNGALAVGNTPFERLELPYEPPEEYDFRIVFTRLDGAEGITQVLTKSGNPFAWCVGFNRNGVAAFGTINGMTGGDSKNPSRARRDAWIENGRPYTMVVAVRNEGLKAFLNDELISQWKTDYRDMGMFSEWRLRDPKRLGVASSDGRVIFHRIEVREVTGKGTFTRGAPAGPTAPAAPATVAAATAPAADTGLVLYLNFDEPPAQGIVRDLSGRGNHGRVEGAAWSPDGWRGGAMRFDIRQRTQRVRVPNSTSLNPQRITIAAWFKSADADQFWNRIADKDWRRGYNLCLGGKEPNKKDWSGCVGLELNKHPTFSDVRVADGGWHHAAGTYDGLVQLLYVDGRLQKPRARWVGEISANNYDLCIGNTLVDYNPQEFLAFDGLIDEFRIYSRALSSEEIAALTNAPGQPAAVAVPDPAALRYGLYFHFDISTFAGYQNKLLLGKASVSAFAPRKMDVRQWAGVTRGCGAKVAVLTAKHEAGFCLWDSKGYDYTAMASPVRTDIVAAFVAACKAEGIVPGVHYSIPDARNEGAVKFKGPVLPGYFGVIKKHAGELAGNYPDLRILLLDAPHRFSPAQRDEILGIVRRANPSCLVLLQDIGNPPSGTSHVAMSLDKSWFWNPNAPLEPLDTIRAGYERAAASRRLFLLNVGIDRNGSIPDNSIQALNSLKPMLNR